jgi:putative polyhydroxyalkanoate system protein
MLRSWPRSLPDPLRKKPMPELNIERQHSLGLEGARLVAERWREQAEQDWGMACASEPGDAMDHMRFERSGVSGELTVSATRFDLKIKLGFLLGAYSGKIEEKIQANLDALLGPVA